MMKRWLWLVLWVLFLAACGPEQKPAEPTTDAATQPDQPRKETGAADVSEPSCVANNDGVIEISEVPFIAGASVAVRQNPQGTEISVHHTGQTNDKGALIWDFTQHKGLSRAQVKTVEPSGYWFLSSFPQAHILAPVTYRNFKGTFFQVLQVGKDALFLSGIASEKEQPEKDKVLLVYDAPVPLLRFPLRVGKEWVVTAKSKGTVGGLPWASTDKYQIRVTHRGSVRLPDIQFDNTLRIEMIVHQTLLGGQTRQIIQILFFHECFGEIVRVESRENERDTNFTKATLLRYISF